MRIIATHESHCISFVTSSSAREGCQTHRRDGSQHPNPRRIATPLGGESLVQLTLFVLRKRSSTPKCVYEVSRVSSTGMECASEFSSIYERALNLYSMHDSRGAIAKYE